MKNGLTYIVGGSLLTAIKSNQEKKGYVKNRTYEQNIQQITQNHIDCVRHSIETQMGMNPNDMFLSNELIIPLFNSISEIVSRQKEGPIRIYGLTMPIGLAVSDFGDHRISVCVREIPFNTIEGIRDYLVEQLLGDYEVYLYTINVVNGLYDPTTFLPTKKYYIRASFVHRSSWEQMTEQSEANRDLHGRLPWNHEPQQNIGDMAQQLNRWLGEQTDWVKDNSPTNQINPKQNIKKHKF